MIGPGNRLPKRGVGRGRHSPLRDVEEDSWTYNNHVSRDGPKQFLPPTENTSDISEALSLFPHPKSLLTRVIQVATSSNRIKVGITPFFCLHNESQALSAHHLLYTCHFVCRRNLSL